MTKSTNRILMVDDEPNVQAGFRRILRGEFDACFATSGNEALSLMDNAGPFPVVVTDMRMPGMNGVELIQNARKKHKDAVFVLLTGNADQATAVTAINDGNIYRFLNKPCEPEQLIETVRAANRQHDVQAAERELIRGTLMGSVKLLTDVLETANPRLATFQKSVRQTARQLCMALGIEAPWQFDLAASLCLIGISICGSNRDALALSDADLDQSAQVGAKLLANIPRFESVAAMVRRQREPAMLPPMLEMATTESRETVGARILRFAVDFDRELSASPSLVAAVLKLKSRPDLYDTRLIEVAQRLELASLFLNRRTQWVQQTLPTKELQLGMIISTDVMTADNLLLLARGHELTPAAIERLRVMARKEQIKDVVEVMVKTTEPAEPNRNPAHCN